MNPILELIGIVFLISGGLTIIIMVILYFFFKKYGERLFNWYMNALDNRFFYDLNILLILAFLSAFWYTFYQLFF